MTTNKKKPGEQNVLTLYLKLRKHVSSLISQKPGGCHGKGPVT